MRTTRLRPFELFRQAWLECSGPVDPTTGLEVLPREEIRAWPSEIRWALTPSHALPGPPGGYAAGVVRFQAATGPKTVNAVALEHGDGLRVPVPEEGHSWLASWELPAIRMALPGAREYHLGPQGLSAWLTPTRRGAFSVSSGLSSEVKVQASTRATWLRLDSPVQWVQPPRSEQTLGFEVLGHPAGLAGEIHLSRGRTKVGVVRVRVEPQPGQIRCRLKVRPEDLGTLATAKVSLQLSLSRLSGAGPLEGFVLLSTEPQATVVPFWIEAGEGAWKKTLVLLPEQFPRSEKGILSARLVARGQAGESVGVRYRRLRLRRSLARVDLPFGPYLPRPYQRLTLDRNDGEAVSVELEAPPEFHSHLEIRRCGEAEFLLIGLAEPEGVLEGVLLARDGPSGLLERIPIRLRGRDSRDEGRVDE